MSHAGPHVPFHLITFHLPFSHRFRILTMANCTEISLLEMVEIMLTGLGEIESIPIVCGNLLHGCFRGIVQQFQGSRALEIGRDHPALYTRWMQFLTVPRSSEVFRATVAKMSDCQCTGPNRLCPTSYATIINFYATDSHAPCSMRCSPISRSISRSGRYHAFAIRSAGSYGLQQSPNYCPMVHA
jgi:hypothetical protein